jgi:fatty acid desaturase
VTEQADTQKTDMQDAARIMRESLGQPVWPTIGAFIALVTLFVGATAAALMGNIPYPLAAFANYIAIHAGFTVLHEASHRALSGGREGWGWIDRLAGRIHAALLIYDYPTFKHLHLNHHQFANESDKDPDFWLQRYPIWQVFALSFLVPLHYLRLYIAAGRSGAISRTAYVTAMVRIGALAVLIVVLLIINPLATFILWLLPAGFASALISLSHRVLHLSEQSPDRTRTTRIIRGERFWEWVMCPFFWLNNHHYLHHVFPRASCLDHDRMFRAEEARLRADGVQIITLGARTSQPRQSGSAP